MSWTRAYRTPLSLFAVFLALLVVFAVTPDPTSGEAGDAEPTSEPSARPHECVVCPIDQECDSGSGQCMFIEHTPPPCIPSAKFDDEAGMCLPEGVVAPPAPTAGRFPRGIRDRRTGRQEMDLPAIGD